MLFHKGQFLEHINIEMNYLINEEDLSEREKIESMAEFILDTIDNKTGFEYTINLVINNDDKCFTINDGLLSETFFTSNIPEKLNEYRLNE